MAMPEDLVLVRHGHSEANHSQKLEKAAAEQVPDEYYDRHNWQQRLTPKGVGQAQMAGAWLVENIGKPEEAFDKRYVSPFIRARETAAHVGGLACEWLVDDRIVERNWGTYGATPFAERAEVFARTDRIRQQSSWYAQLDGGESLSDTVLLRVRDWFDTLHREVAQHDVERVLAVTHGELMWTIRYALERMLPEEWDTTEADKKQRINNGSIIWYSRRNPEDQTDVRGKYGWRRMVYPDNESRSPFGGAWVPLQNSRRFSGQQLLQSVEAVPRFYEDDLVEAAG